MKHEKLKRFAVILKDRFSGTDLGTASVIIAYYLLLSLFPLLIAVGSILPLLGLTGDGLLPYLETIVPPDVLPVLEPMVRGLLASGSGGLFSVSLLAAIWSSSKGIVQLQRGVNMAYGIPRSGSFITKRFISLVTILLLLLLLVAFALVFSFGEMLLQALEPALPWAASLNRLLMEWRWPVVLVFLFCVLVLLYRATPDVQGLRIRQVLPGAGLATAGLLALVQLFTLYLQFFSRRLSGYGTLGAFFLLMFWLNFSAAIIIIGAVLNATLSEYRRGPAREAVGRLDNMIEHTKTTLMDRLSRLFKRKKK